MHWAIKRGSLLRLKTLAEQGANIGMANRVMAFQTPLMLAAQSAHLEICELEEFRSYIQAIWL